MNATIYTTDGQAINVTPKNGTDFSLAELNAIVEGYIEILFSLDGKKIMVINEEGKLDNLPYNTIATDIARGFFGLLNDHIVGNALICDRGMVQ